MKLFLKWGVVVCRGLNIEQNANRKRSDLERLGEYKESLSKHPKLRYLFLEMTSKCNMACLHCGSSCGNNEEYGALTYDEICSFLKQLAGVYDPSGIMLCVTGGEPLLRHDLFAIMKYAVSLGFSWGMTSNGTLIDEKAVQNMRGTKMKTISVSLDGLPDTHDWLRNRQGSFQQAVDGVRLLIEAGCFQNVQVTTVVHKKNIHQLQDMYEYIKKLGVRSWRLTNIEPIGRANSNTELFLDRKGFRELFDFICSKRGNALPDIQVTYGCSHYLTPEYEREIRNYYFICGSGVYAASILYNGDIYSCLDIERRPELIQGNIRQDNFINIWENKFTEFRKDRYKLSSKCNACNDKLICRGDSAHTWNYDNNEPNICLKDIL